MREVERGFDDLHSLNVAGFRAMCGLLNVIIVQNEAGRPLTENEKQRAARKGDDYFWSIADTNINFTFNNGANP